MAYTYKQLLKRSLRLIQAIPKGDFEPDPGEMADAFESLQNLFDEISSERFGQYTITRESFTLTSNVLEYSIGSGADLDTTRPKKIVQAWINDSGSDFSVKIIARENYNHLVNKTVTGRPYYLYYEETYPNGRIDLYPSPSQAYTLFLESWKEITKPAAATDTVNLPSEYIQFFVNQMAVNLAPEYGTEAAQSVQREAQLSRRRLKNIHSSNVPQAYTDPLNGRREYDISGDYWI